MCTVKKNYSGVAILYDKNYIGKAQKVTVGIGNSELDEEGRCVTVEFADFNLISVYTPHSGVGDLKRLDFRVKIWDRAFEQYINDL